MTNHPNRSLTPKQREVLKQECVSGVCIRYVWTWLMDGVPVTAQVKALIAKGYMHDSYYAGGHASASITESGKAALAR
jgi:hypothetical protein